ncbi:MAG: molybdopterin-guanine dinucleotide biosynthesis protein B [Ruminococcus sp.]
MKICTIVGIRKSGKTTTVTELVKELKKRGYRVGTVKTVFCPAFSMDQEGSNTDRHRKAGADIIGVKGKREMNLIYPRGMDDNHFFPLFPVDILLVEGDYEAGVPRIVCAHKREDALERINDFTVAVSGKIAEREESFGSLPVFNIKKEAAAAADLIEKLPEAVFPIPLLDTPEGVSSFCQCGCHKAKGKCGGALERHRNSSGRKHIFLTGKKQAGKSTILKRALKEKGKEVCGYYTLPYEINGVRKGFYLHSIKEMEEFENDSPISVRAGKHQSYPLTETFETLGTAVLRGALQSDEWMIADEVGKLERDAVSFQQAFFQCLDQKSLVLGVLQDTDTPFVNAIKERPDVEVWTVTEENRERVYQRLIKRL